CRPAPLRLHRLAVVLSGQPLEEHRARAVALAPERGGDGLQEQRAEPHLALVRGGLRGGVGHGVAGFHVHRPSCRFFCGGFVVPPSVAPVIELVPRWPAFCSSGGGHAALRGSRSCAARSASNAATTVSDRCWSPRRCWRLSKSLRRSIGYRAPMTGSFFVRPCRTGAVGREG